MPSGKHDHLWTPENHPKSPGRPKISPEERRFNKIQRQYIKKLVDKLVPELYDEGLTAQDLETRLKYISQLENRLLGKPTERVEAESNVNEHRTVNIVSYAKKEDK